MLSGKKEKKKKETIKEKAFIYVTSGSFSLILSFCWNWLYIFNKAMTLTNWRWGGLASLLWPLCLRLLCSFKINNNKWSFNRSKGRGSPRRSNSGKSWIALSWCVEKFPLQDLKRFDSFLQAWVFWTRFEIRRSMGLNPIKKKKNFSFFKTLIPSLEVRFIILAIE